MICGGMECLTHFYTLYRAKQYQTKQKIILSKTQNTWLNARNKRAEVYIDEYMIVVQGLENVILAQQNPVEQSLWLVNKVLVFSPTVNITLIKMLQMHHYINSLLLIYTEIMIYLNIIHLHDW